MIKKIACGIVMVAGFISCTDDYTDWTPVQSNSQEESKSVTVEAVSTEEVDFATDDSTMVQLFQPTVTVADEHTTTYTVTVWNEDKSASEVIVANGEGYVSAGELEAIVKSLYGFGPEPRKLILEIEGYTVIDGQNFKNKLEDITIIVKLKKFPEYIYEIGNEGGWSTAHALRGPNLDGKYQGYYWMDGEFKFKPNADDWNGDWEYAGEGQIADNGGSNMPGLEAGFYQIDVDLAAMTYSATKVESISIIGTVNGNWNTDTDLAYNQTTGAWEVETALNAGEMKFRMNHGWDISWGGANGDSSNYGDLTQNGGQNLVLEAAGTYLVQLYIQYEGANRVVITAK